MEPHQRRVGSDAGLLRAIAAFLALSLALSMSGGPAGAVAPAPARPSVTTVAPSVGATSGGTLVTLVGRGLDTIDKVTFGGVAARRLVHVSPRKLTVAAPAHAPGGVALRLYDGAALRFSWAQAFTYVARPSITSLTPDAGPLAGRTITVQGTNLARGAQVLFDGERGRNVRWLSNSRLTVRAPAHAAGSVPVRIKTTAGMSAAGAQATFTYGTRPEVSSYSPESGPEVGGTLVRIDGSHLDDVTRVMFGDKEGTALTHVSPTQVTVRSPAHAEGYEAIRVINSFGSVSPGYFSFEAPGLGGLTWSAGEDLGNSGHGGLTGVDCPTTAFCVGFDERGAVVTYAGGAWSSPVFVHENISDLSCASPSYCVAVDYGFPESPSYVWNGTSWREGAPLPPYVGAVDCWGTGSCLAVGSDQAFALSDGEWNIQALEGEGFLATDVSCGSPSFCVAVDEINGTAQEYDGTDWSVTIEDSGYARLRRISCLPGGTCAALDGWGGYTDGWGLWTYDGTTWESHAAPIPDSGASDLSCSPDGTCTVVGTEAGTMSGWAGNGGGFAIAYDGGWQDPAYDIGGSLDGISCASDTACTAVGAFLVPARLDGDTRVERQNGFAVRGTGTTWTEPVSIDPDRYGDLGEISCVSATFCMSATGARFDGTTWDASVPINPYGQGMGMYLGWVGSDAHISCTSESFCLALGNENDNIWDTGFYRGWWSTWDGSAWSPPTYLSHPVRDVSCVSSTHCVMTAMSSDRDGTPQARVFEGATWDAPTDLPGNDVGEIDCVNATTCVATRTSDLVRLSGGTWSPLAIADVDYVHDVDCVTTTFCLVSVSDEDSAGHYDQASVRRWNGTTWSAGFSSGEINGFSVSFDVDCVATDVCFASQRNTNGFGSNQVWAYDGSTWSGPDQPGHTESKWPSVVRCATRDVCLAMDPWGAMAIGVRH